MVIRTRRAALRDRTPVTNTPAASTSKTRGRVKEKAKDTSAKVSKKRELTLPSPDVEAEDEPVVEDETVQTHGEMDKSQEELSIGGFSFEDSQQSGVELPGLGLGESVILQSTPVPNWRRKQQTTKSTPPQPRSTSIIKQPAGLKASSPLPPSSPIPTSPFPSSRPVERERGRELEHELPFVEEAPSEHPSDDPFGFLSTERKLRAKKGQPKRRDKGKAVERFTPSPEPTAESGDDHNGIEDLYASEEDAPPPQRYQTSPPRQLSPHSERSSSLTPLQSPHTPSTPNKRSGNKRKLARSEDSSPELSAAPTSPSPSKPKVRSKPSAGATETGATTRGRTRKKRKSEETVEDEDMYDEMDPSQIERHLEALLPKPISKSKKKRAQAQAKGTRHSTRKITKRAKAPTPSSSEDESEPSPPRRPTSKRGGKKPASRTGKAKKDREEEEDIDLDELEVTFLSTHRIPRSNIRFIRRKRVESGLSTLKTWTTINSPRRTSTSCEYTVLCDRLRMIFGLLFIFWVLGIYLLMLCCFCHRPTLVLYHNASLLIGELLILNFERRF